MLIQKWSDPLPLPMEVDSKAPPGLDTSVEIREALFLQLVATRNARRVLTNYVKTGESEDVKRQRENAAGKNGAGTGGRAVP